MQNLFKTLKLEALAVNDQVAAQDEMRRYRFEYNRLDDFDSPQPRPLDRNINMDERGIWLRWVLPEEDRTQGEDGTFPDIPNRYLITRTAKSGKETVSTVLECDCPVSGKLTDEEYNKILPYSSRYMIGEETMKQLLLSEDEYRSSVYQHPSEAGNAYYVNIGVPFAAKDWEERESASSCMFLTACAPGNPDFTGYVPFNSNVLSYFDDLKDVEDDTFTYSVIGWYSNTEENPVFYGGQLFEVCWAREDYNTYSDDLADIKQSRDLNVAIGENSSQAFLAYLKNRLFYNQKLSGEELDHFMLLLSAMDAGNVKDLSDTDNGWLVEETVFMHLFRSRSGGRKETAELDKEIRKLSFLRRELFDTWWENGYFHKNGDVCSEEVKEAFEKELDASEKDSLISRTIAQYEKVLELCGQEDASQETTADSRYWMKKDPYLVVSGLNEPEDLCSGSSGEETLSRKEEELLVSDWGEGEPPCQMPETKGTLPKGVKLLYAEAMYIAQNVYGKEETSAQGKMPGYDITAWHQTWRPAFMEWRLDYQEGLSYHFNGFCYTTEKAGSIDDSQVFAYGGIAALTAHRKQLFTAQLKKLAEESGSEKVKETAEKAEEWKLLGQELSGFWEQMAQHDLRAFRRPAQEAITGSDYLLDEVIGIQETDDAGPDSGGIESAPDVDGNVVPPFRLMQKGKGRLSDLLFYDAFGRCLPLVQDGDKSGLYDSDNFPLIAADRMKGTDNQEDSKNRFLLAPCLLQYAKLSATLQGDGENGIYGFLVPNHLSHSLLAYSNDGILAGELYCAAGESGARRAVYRKVSDISNGGLQDFIDSHTGKSETEFNALLDVLDDAFWTMESAADRKEDRIALLAGRPIALSRLKLYVDFYGGQRKNIDWNSDKAQDTDLSFPVRLGDISRRKDGLAGYFEEGSDCFSVFRSVAQPEEECDNIVQIGQEKDNTSAYLSIGCGEENAVSPYILYDPLLGLHIYSGILPVKKVYQDRQKILDIYKKMELEFRAGPLLRKKDGGAYSIREGYVVFQEGTEDDKKEFKWLGKEGIWNEQ